MAENWQRGGFGLYIHWPFCASKCPYCDFNSHVAASIDQNRWQRAYLAALDRYAHETHGRVLSSVYFGGGTPSLMDPALVGAILDRVAGHWVLGNDVEITLEANPTSVEAKRFLGFREAGVNRVSMGIQALNDTDLRRLGRMHTVAEAIQALVIARETFSRVNFDLIYARQDQTLEDWRRELSQALSFAPEHMSLYQLTVEDGTVFGERHARGQLRGLPDEDLGADMYFLTQEMTAERGLFAYEVSNHAQNGAESRHNLIYWRAGDYLGIGPGAHGRLGFGPQRFATETPLAPGAWLEAVEKGGTGESARQLLSRTDQAGEAVMMGLRTVEGVDLDFIQSILGVALNINEINKLIDLGMVEQPSGQLIVTARGRPVLNAITAALLPD